MRTRTFAAAALATWSKTAVVAPLVTSPDVARAAEPEPATCDVHSFPFVPTMGHLATGPAPAPEATDGYVWTSMAYKYGQCPGTLSLQASSDGATWTTLATSHAVAGTWPQAYAQHQCLAGTWSYRAEFVSDDGSYKAGSGAAQYKCGVR